MLVLSVLGGKTEPASALSKGLCSVNSINTSSGFHWAMTVQLTAEQQASIQQNNLSTMSALQANSVMTAVSANGLTLSGQDSLDQMRMALFNTASPLTDFLSGPVEMNLYMPADSMPVTLNLEARVTTGSRWEVLSGADSLYAVNGDSTYQMMYKGIGVPSIQTIQLRPLGSGNTVVHLIYRRPFGPPEATHAKLSVWLPSVNPSIEISNPNPVAPKPDVSAADASTPDPYAALPAITLPSSLDWRTAGIVPTMIRDQGGCGSCWAFATVGSMESAIAKAGGGLQDLSEQFLNDCNLKGWNCEVGGDTANAYHYNTLGKNQSQVGAVLESVDPYQGGDSICNKYSHAYTLSSWSYVPVGGNTMSKPTVNQIKTAIITYGPVTTSVCADIGWNKYTGGVYNPPAGTWISACGTYGQTNHMVVLEGWDDSTQSWIVRNSWGPRWGEKGYMRIKYDPTYTHSRIGEDTSWVAIQLTPKNFSKTTPVNGAAGQATSLTLNWGASAAASSYQYCYATVNPCSNWSDNITATSVPVSGLQAGDTYYWHVRAVNSIGTTFSNGNASADWSFTIAAPPGDFGKSSPASNATLQSTSPTLQWSPSTEATNYEYCYGIASPCTNWTNNNLATSASLSGLKANTTYYWDVRAVNSLLDTIYSDGGPDAIWSFATKPVTTKATFQSVGAQDGWVRETGYNTNLGGYNLSTGNLVAGDDVSNRREYSILSFNTTGLPDTAVVTAVTLKLDQQSISSASLFTKLGALTVDIRKPYFGAVPGLENGDFQAAADASAVGVLGTPVSDLYSAILGSAAFPSINLTGTTQFRLRFLLSNHDGIANWVQFYSGEAAESLRPTLIITYYVP
jgi:inhibitor of cysteine peptidase